MKWYQPLLPAVMIAIGQAQSPVTAYKFDFGGRCAPGYISVAAGTLYSDATGYGFEPGAVLSTEQRPGAGALTDGFVTGTKPFFFSAALPEGNYKVTVILGDPGGSSTTTVKAELRRLMLEKVHTARHQLTTKTFIVNIRRPMIPGGKQVKFKERERTSEAWAWDGKLTLEFSNVEPKICSLTIEKVDVPTIYIVGDSTSTDQAKEPYNSWGQMLTRFFTPEVAIANHGESGETLRSFIEENRLAKVMSLIRPDDYLFIQFGHNDQKEKGEGVGPFTTYKADLKRFVSDARERGATPVLITSMNRRTFGPGGEVTNSLDGFPEAVRQVAQENHVPLIDLNAMSKILYEAFGPERSGVLFAAGDSTHHSDYGSYELAKCIVRGIREAKLPLAKYLITDIAPFDPARPDPYDQFDIPADPDATAVKPYGN